MALLNNIEMNQPEASYCGLGSVHSRPACLIQTYISVGVVTASLNKHRTVKNASSKVCVKEHRDGSSAG